MPNKRYNAPSRKFGKIFIGILSVELYRVRARNWNLDRVVVFSQLSYKAPKAKIILRKFASAYCFDFITGIVGCLTKY